MLINFQDISFLLMLWIHSKPLYHKLTISQHLEQYQYLITILYEIVCQEHEENLNHVRFREFSIEPIDIT